MPTKLEIILHFFSPVKKSILHSFIKIHFISVLRGKVNILDCDIVVSSNPSHAITFTFELMPLGEDMNDLIPQLCVK